MLVLLAVLVSYNLDLECFLESQTCHQIQSGHAECEQVQSVHAQLDSNCAQPTALPLLSLVAILPPPTDFRPPAPVTVELVECSWVEPELPRIALLSVPLGLRAPPLV